MDPIQPIAPDRSVQRVDLRILSPLEREREKDRRERERRRRQTPSHTPSESPENRPDEPNSGIDVRV